MKKYTFSEKQMLIRDARTRLNPLHQHWKVLEGLYRTGLRRDLDQRDFSDLTPTAIPGRVLKTINMTLPHLSLMATSIISRDPQMIVTPIGGLDETTDNATFAQAVLHYFWKRTDATDDVKAATEDMLKLGNGFVKVGWEYVADEAKKPQVTPTDDISPLIDGTDKFLQENREGLAEVPFTYNTVLVDEPFVEYVSPYDMYLPKDARRMDTSRWVAQRLRLPVDTLRERFGDKVNINIDASVLADSLAVNYTNERNQLPEVLTYATVYEFYDLVARELTVLQVGGSEPLFEGSIPFSHRYPPFVHFRNYNDGGMQFWAFGDLENIAGIQLMLGEVTSAQIDDLKRSGNKYAIRKRHLTPELKKQLESPLPDQVIVLDLPETGSLDDVIRPLARTATPPDTYNMDAKLQDAMRGVLGINDFQAGGVGANRMSATAAAVVDGVATLRAQDKLAAVESGISGIGLRILLLCQEFLDDDRAIRIAGANGTMWLNVKQSDIYGEFKVQVEGGSTRALNPATRAQRGIQTLQTVVPVLQSLQYDPTNAIRMALRDMGYDPNYLLVKTEPTPQPAQPEIPAEGQTPPVGMPSPDLMAQMQQQSAPAPAPVEAVQQEFGGPGAPAATNGTLAL